MKYRYIKDRVLQRIGVLSRVYRSGRQVVILGQLCCLLMGHVDFREATQKTSLVTSKFPHEVFVQLKTAWDDQDMTHLKVTSFDEGSSWQTQ